MKQSKHISVLFLVQAAMVAAIYVVLTLIGASYAYGPIQVRLSEALTILPAFTPAAIPVFYRLPSEQYPGRMYRPGHFIRERRHTDRRAFYMDAAQQEQVSCSASAHHCQRAHRAVCPEIRLHGTLPDPFPDAYRRDRRDHLLRGAWHDHLCRAE